MTWVVSSGWQSAIKLLVLVYTELLKPPITCVWNVAPKGQVGDALITGSTLFWSPVHHVLSAHRLHLSSPNATSNQLVPKVLFSGSRTESTQGCSRTPCRTCIFERNPKNKETISYPYSFEYFFLRVESQSWRQTRANPHSSFSHQRQNQRSQGQETRGHALFLTPLPHFMTPGTLDIDTGDQGGELTNPRHHRAKRRWIWNQSSDSWCRRPRSFH